MMIAQGLLVLCVVAYSQGFLFNPAPARWVPVPIYKPAPKVIVKHVPIVKRVRVPVYIHREISVPQYIDRPYPVPVGGGVSQGGVSQGGGAGASIGSFGLNAEIEDADTVNIVAGVSGVSSSRGSVTPVRRGYGYSDDSFGRSVGSFRRSSSTFGSLRRSFGGPRRSIGGLHRSSTFIGGSRKSLGGFRRSLSGLRQSSPFVGGFRRSLRSFRRSSGGTHRLRRLDDEDFSDRFNNGFNDDNLRRGFRDSRGVLRGGRFNN